MMFTGTTQQQDTRFSDKEKKLMKQMKFGDCLNKRVDMSKVKLDVLRPWIRRKLPICYTWKMMLSLSLFTINWKKRNFLVPRKAK
ncbi:Serine/arginine repetitive matrix protein 1 [Lucilia cuprina]|nr:Serine/arginine repetitive matrix protein 1 [Lucilia cuprina]